MNSSNNAENGDNVSASDAINFLMDSSLTDGMFYNQDQSTFNFFGPSSSGTDSNMAAPARQSDPVGTNYFGAVQQQASAPVPGATTGVSSETLNPLYHNAPQHFNQVSASGIPFSAQSQPNAATSFQSQAAASVGPNQQQQQQQQLQQIRSNSGSMPPPIFPNPAASVMLMNLPPGIQGFHQQVLQNSQQGTSVNGMNEEEPVQDDTVTKNMTSEEKRRYERNLREQQRSYKISQQIKELRIVLQESNIPFKPNKYSILLSVVDYIKELQTRAVYLDQEHQKLLNTLSQTSDLVNNGSNIHGDKGQNSGEAALDTCGRIGNDSELLFVKGLDYKNIFLQCSNALCVASLDGRLLDCNSQFEKVSGYDKEELKQQSLYSFLTSSAMEDLFVEMGKLVEEKQSEDKTNAPDSNYNKQRLRAFWCGQVHRKDNDKESTHTPDGDLYMNITLTRSRDGRPQFLNCALTAK